ncbi:MAG: alkaline phosphatase family protein [Myxococcota bacterium]
MRRVIVACLAFMVFGCERQTTSGSIVVIGIDGAEWSVIEPLIRAGQMPNLAKLMSEGAYGDLETIEPILSPIIWTSIATGHPPERHGITWFMERDPATGETSPIGSRTRKVKAIWNIASDADKTVATVGWWATWPAEQVNGWIVSDHIAGHGFGLRAKEGRTELGKTHPASLLDSLRPLVVRPTQITDGEVRRFMDVTDAELETRNGNAMEFSNPLHHFLYALATLKTYRAAGRLTLRRTQPDLAMFYFEAVDSLSHLFMKYMPPRMNGLSDELQRKFSRVVPEIYRQQDEVLGELIAAAAPNTTFVVVSDHGFKTGGNRLNEAMNTKVSDAHQWHEKQGVIVVAGPDIVAGTRLNAHIYDITPTLLYLLGLPVGEDMPGRVLTEIVSTDRIARQTIATIPTHETTATPAARNVGATSIAPAVRERLEALGYLSTGNSTSEVLGNRVSIALRKGDLVSARAVVAEMLVKDAHDGNALFYLAAIEERAGDGYAAAEIYERLRRHPTTIDRAEAALGPLYLRLQQPERSLEISRKLAGRKPSAQTWYHVGLAHESSRSWESAEDAYRQAIALNPDHAVSLNNAGRCALKRGSVDRAADYFQRAAEADPVHAESRYNLALLADHAGKKKRALQFLKDSIAVAPEFEPGLWALATRYAASGLFPEAESMLATLIELNPTHRDYWSLRAEVARARQHARAAEVYAQKAKQLTR